MKKLIFLLALVCIIQGCVKNKCVVCNDATGKSTGLKCFTTVSQALAWEAAQDSANPNHPISCK